MSVCWVVWQKDEASMSVQTFIASVDRQAVTMGQCVIAFVVGVTNNDHVCQLLQDAMLDDASQSLINKLVLYHLHVRLGHSQGTYYYYFLFL